MKFEIEIDPEFGVVFIEVPPSIPPEVADALVRILRPGASEAFRKADGSVVYSDSFPALDRPERVR